MTLAQQAACEALGGRRLARYARLVGESASSTPIKRRYPRVDLPRGPMVAWQGGGKSGVGTIATVALGGLFICTHDPPDSGSTLKLLFDLPSGEVRGRAGVRYVVPDQGMGVQFVMMNYEDRARLYQLLSRLLRYDDSVMSDE